MKSTIEELVAFITIVDTGSFVAAAEHLKANTFGGEPIFNPFGSKVRCDFARANNA